MIKTERERLILSMVEQKEIVSVKALCAALPEVSAVTVRRDIVALAARDKLMRVRGGVKRNGRPVATAPTLPFDADLASSITADLTLHDNDHPQIFEHIDAVILPPIDGHLARTIHRRARRSGVLCLDESGPDGDGIYLGVDNTAAGFDIGQQAARDHSGQQQLHCLLIGHDGQTNTQQRQAGFLKGLQSAFSGDIQTVFADARGVYMEAFRQARDALESMPRIDLIFAINDHSMLAAIDAARSLRRLDVAGYCVGGEGGLIFDELQKHDILRGCAAMHPQVVARCAVNAISRSYANASDSDPVITPHHVLTRDNLAQYYAQDNGEWQLHQQVADQLAPLPARSEADHREHSILFIQHYPTHHWYHSLSIELHRYCDLMGYGYHTASLKSQLVDEMRHTRREVAARAAQLVQPGQTILLNGGETSCRLAFELRDIKPLTVISNSLAVLKVLADCPDMDVILTGGTYRASHQDLVGTARRAVLENVRADIAFFSVDGLSRSFGASCADEQDALTVRLFTAFARRNVVLADHSVLAEDASFRAMPFDRINDIVTDFGVSNSQRIEYSVDGVSMIVAGAAHLPSNS